MTKQKSELIKYILELLEPAEGISCSSMFGGYAVRKDGLNIAIIANDEIYFKVDELNKSDFEALDSRPFTYESKGKTVTLSNWSMPLEILEDSDQMLIWVDKSYQAAKRKKLKTANKI